MKWLILMFVILLLLPAFAFAYCSSPYAPQPPSTYNRPNKPTVPYCVNTYSNTHTCSDWEINFYNSELEQYRYDVEEYIRKLQNYVNEANNYANGAVQYAKCEIRNIE